jgi:DNA-binding CsgD family transcriptional regulator
VTIQPSLGARTEDRPPAAGEDLLGREKEEKALAALLDAAERGTGAALVLAGAAGVGKSALLRQAAREVSGTSVVWLPDTTASSVPGPAGLYRVLAPLLSVRATLPAALSGEESGSLGAGLAVLRLLVTVSQERPLLCLVDDADRLASSAQAALAVAARRLTVSPVVLLFAMRTQAPPFADLPCLCVDDLDVSSAERLLDRLTSGTLDPLVRRRLVTAAGRNPQCLTELAARWGTAELGRIAFSPAPAPASDSLLASYGAGARGLPADTRSLMLALAAASPDEDVTAAGPALGFTPDSWRPAFQAGWLEGWPRPRFTHPLTRSAIYFGASPRQRHLVHTVLAGLPGPSGRKAWHRAACALPGPDEPLARELAEAAEAVAVAPERCLLRVLAGDLSADPGTRGDHYAAGAREALAAGASSYALALADEAEIHSCDNVAMQAKAAAVREQARGELGHPPRRPSAAWLLEAARAELPASPAASRENTLGALSEMVLARDGTGGITPAELARVMAAVNASGGAAPDLGTLLLHGFGRLIAGDYAAAAGPLRQALLEAENPAVLAGGVPGWFPLVAVTSVALWDDAAGIAWLDRVIARARSTGALRAERRALDVMRHLEAASGQPATSGDLSRTAADSPGLARIAPVVAALGERRFPAALRAAQDIRARDALNLEQEVLPYLVEAAAACGRLDEAHDALETLRGRAAAAGTDWAQGQLHCAEAVLADGELADAAFGAAIEALRRTRRAAELGRAHLLYGEALTSRGRTVEAGIQLRTAVGMFSELGTAAYASRARRALRLAGERPASREPVVGETLTDQELRIARLAAVGATNRDIGQQLFIGATTVDYHLHKVYRKLGVSSRRAIGEAVLHRRIQHREEVSPP